MIALCHARADHEIITLGEAGDSEITRNAAAFADQRGKAGPPRHSRNRFASKASSQSRAPDPLMRVSSEVRDIE